MRLDYPVTRQFTWRGFAPISLASAVIAIAFLIVINTALTGYQTITVFQSNFNATQTLWFNKFIPFRNPQPGTLCESHVFNVGDPLTTNYSFFQWNIASVLRPNAGESGISYSGTPLTFCDVTSVFIDGSLISWTMDFTVISSCVDGDLFNVTASTSFSASLLPGRYSQLVGLERVLTDGTIDRRGWVLDGILRTASQDVGTRAYNALLFSNQTSIVSLSAQANFNYCPMSFGLNASCAIDPPQFSIYSAATIYPNTTIRTYQSGVPIDPIWNPWVFDNDTELAVFNLLQALYAAVRIDLGNPSSNNFILNPAAMNGTIAPNFPLTLANGEAFSPSSLYSIWVAPFPELQQVLPVTVSGPASIQVVYPCQFQQLKGFGSLVISVLVATFSMFSTGWGIFMLLATAIVKRHNPSSNRCDGHCFRHRVDLDPSWFDTYGLQAEAYGLQAGEFSSLKGKGSDVRDVKGVVYQSVTQSPISTLKDPPIPDSEIGSTSRLNADTSSES